MATMLKDLSITSVDLVDRGANPDARLNETKTTTMPRKRGWMKDCLKNSCIGSAKDL